MKTFMQCVQYQEKTNVIQMIFPEYNPSYENRGNE